MQTDQAFDTLYLDNDGALDYEIRTIFTDQLSTIRNWHTHLSREAEMFFVELDAQGLFIRGFN